MKTRKVEPLLRRHGHYCQWCGIGLSRRSARIVERPAGPVPLCGTCEKRHERPDLHPYVHRGLAAKGL